MAKTTGSNITNVTIQWAGNDSDTFARSDVANTAQALDLHNHTSTKGLGIQRIQTGTTPTVSGEVQVDTTNKDLVVYDGTAARTVRVGVWTDFTPTMTQSGALTITIASARYAILGKTALVQVILTITSSGTTNNAITLASIPAAIAAKVNTVAGAARYFDSGNAYFNLSAEFASNTTVVFYGYNGAGAFGIAPNFAAATNDILMVQLTYEIG